MKEIRIHGRGGQGAVTAAELMAIAAFLDGKHSQAFPSFGPERRGAPVSSFVRIDSKEIRTRQHVYNPDYVVVLDSTLLDVVDVFKGMNSHGKVIINSRKSPAELGLKKRVYVVDAETIAREELGVPIVNTAILGAFARITGEFTRGSLKRAVRERFPPELARKNTKAVERAFREVC